MSQREIKLRKILDKIITKGAIASLVGIIPAAMAGAPFLALGLGIAAMVGHDTKDAAWWAKGGHHYGAQDKYGVKETNTNQVYENVGTTVDKVLSTFEFSEAGNDEMIEFAEYLLSPEGPKNIAMAIKNKLKGEGGEKYFTSNPEKLQSFLSKLR